MLEQEAVIQDEAVRGADRSVQITLNQYRAGTVSYLNVVTAQNTHTPIAALRWISRDGDWLPMPGWSRPRRRLGRTG